MPVYMTLHKHFGLDTEMPFMKLDWQKMLPCFAPPTKAKLREAYRSILPGFIIDKAKVAPAFSERGIWRYGTSTLNSIILMLLSQAQKTLGHACNISRLARGWKRS